MLARAARRRMGSKASIEVMMLVIGVLRRRSAWMRKSGSGKSMGEEAEEAEETEEEEEEEEEAEEEEGVRMGVRMGVRLGVRMGVRLRVRTTVRTTMRTSTFRNRKWRTPKQSICYSVRASMCRRRRTATTK
jgi:hypothetical protein